MVRIQDEKGTINRPVPGSGNETAATALQWDTITAGVAHELKNPLAAIRGFLQLLAERVANDETNSHYVKVVMWELGRLERLVDDFVCLGRMSVRLEPRNLAEIISEVAAVVGPQAQRQKVELSFKAEACPQVPADRYLIKQILWNLISNALAAMPNGGRLTLELVQESKDWVEVICRDTGGGIPEEVLPHIFEPNFTTKEDGTGLGLTICQRIAALHRGFLTVDTQEGVGTVVTLRLPVVPSGLQ